MFYYDYIKKMTTPYSTPKFYGYNSSDLHAWVELENGEILDYPIETLKSCSKYGTTRVKYVPFKQQHQEILYKKYTNKLSAEFNEYPHIYFINTGGYCMYRAIVIHRHLQTLGKKSKVVFGSLGFIQDDNSIFYEFG